MPKELESTLTAYPSPLPGLDSMTSSPPARSWGCGQQQLIGTVTLRREQVRRLMWVAMVPLDHPTTSSLISKICTSQSHMRGATIEGRKGSGLSWVVCWVTVECTNKLTDVYKLRLPCRLNVLGFCLFSVRKLSPWVYHRIRLPESGYTFHKNSQVLYNAEFYSELNMSP